MTSLIAETLWVLAGLVAMRFGSRALWTKEWWLETRAEFSLPSSIALIAASFVFCLLWFILGWPLMILGLIVSRYRRSPELT